MHPAYIAAIASACLCDKQNSEEIRKEAEYKLSGMKTAVQSYHKLRISSLGGGGDDEEGRGSEKDTMEEVVCVLLRLCLNSDSGSDSGSGSDGQEDGLARLVMREEVRVTILLWVKNEMFSLISRPAVADLLLHLVRQTFPATGKVKDGWKMQAVVLAMANVLSKYLHSYIGVEVNYTSSTSFSSSVSSLHVLIQSVSAVLTPLAQSSLGMSSAVGRTGVDEQEMQVKKVISHIIACMLSSSLTTFILFCLSVCIFLSISVNVKCN